MGFYGLPEDIKMELEYNDGLTAFDSRASVASSDWGNVSSSKDSASSADNQLSAKDIANWRECAEIWSSHHHLAIASIKDVVDDPHLSQDIFSVFQLAYSIPGSWFHINPAEHSPLTPRVQQYLAQITQNDPAFFGENDSTFQGRTSEHALALAVNGLEIHEAALRLAHYPFKYLSDEHWASEIHDNLIVQCARGHLLEATEIWTLPINHIPNSDSSPIITRILDVRKIRPRGALSLLPQSDAPHPERPFLGPLFAAAFSTRAQIASHLRDTPEPLALHTFNVMATSAVLAQLGVFGIDMPVFGVLLDRNVVRFHVDWRVAAQNHDYNHLVTLPLGYADADPSGLSTPFRDFDLTRPDDALRVTLMLDAIRSYSENRLAPMVLSALQSVPWNPDNTLPLSQGEITSQEKVQAWMQSGAVEESQGRVEE